MNVVDLTLSLIAPHICKGCGHVGSALCERCINNISANPYCRCVECRIPTKNQNLCPACQNRYQIHTLYTVGLRQGTLRQLVGDYKFNSERESAYILAGLIYRRLPDNIVDGTNIVYIPTIQRHIRARGFDHMELVANHLSQLIDPTTRVSRQFNPLIRLDNHVQHGQSYISRQIKIKSSLGAIKPDHPPRRVLLIDDIWTTGATIRAATQLLHSIGIPIVDVAIIAVQPQMVDKKSD